MANSKNGDATANAQTLPSFTPSAASPDVTAADVENAAIQIDAVMHAMHGIAATIGSPTDCILWTLAYALNDSLRLLGQEVRS